MPEPIGITVNDHSLTGEHLIRKAEIQNIPDAEALKFFTKLRAAAQQAMVLLKRKIKANDTTNARSA